MFFELSRIIASVPSRWRRIFAIRFDKSRIQTVDSLVEFVQTRAAYVAQTSLYGYLKTRMGTRFRQIFEDEEFLPSINNSKWRTYAACLSDLAVFTTATAGIENGLSDREITDRQVSVGSGFVQCFLVCPELSRPYRRDGGHRVVATHSYALLHHAVSACCAQIRGLVVVIHLPFVLHSAGVGHADQTAAA